MTGGSSGVVEEVVEQATGIPIIPGADDILKKGGKKLILGTNRKVGKEAEKMVTEGLEKEFKGGEVLEQVSGKFEDGKRTVFDNVVIDKKTGKAKMVNETKSGNATYTKNQSRYHRDGESVTLTGKNAGAAKGQVINKNNTPSRTSRVDVEKKSIEIE